MRRARYGDNGHAMIFVGEDWIATIVEGDRDEVTTRLRLLGLNPKRWRSTKWGAEATLTRRA